MNLNCKSLLLTTVSPTWYVVALGFNAGRENGVFWDGVTVVIQRRKLTGDFIVTRHQHWRKNFREEEKVKKN